MASASGCATEGTRNAGLCVLQHPFFEEKLRVAAGGGKNPGGVGVIPRSFGSLVPNHDLGMPKRTYASRPRQRYLSTAGLSSISPKISTC